MTSTGDVELRAAIKFCVGLEKTPSETFRMLQSSKTTVNCSWALVFKWHRRFRHGRRSIEDDGRCGRPSKVKCSITDQVKDLVYSDRRHTLRCLAAELGVSSYTVHDILKNNLGMSKVCARWVPRLLKDNEREKRVRCSEEFVRRYEREGEEFLDRIVTTDETWLWHFDPETKAQSCVWKTPGTPPPKKARVQKSSGKHMYIFFMDRKGMILQHQVPDGQTVTASYYSKVLRRDLMQALKKKRPDLDPERIIFHQDNASGHRADSTLLEISLLGFEILQHPPYSPDLAPMDFRVFPEIKAALRGERFENASELSFHTRNVVSAYDSDWYSETYSKWLQRHRKCIEVRGDYVEKV